MPAQPGEARLEGFPGPLNPAQIMYAIVRDRSRCLTLNPGQELWIDRCPELKPGGEITFDQVHLLKKEDGSIEIGSPTIEGASVVAEVLGEAKDRKIYVATFKRRKTFRRRVGHRETYTRIRVREIRTV